MIKLGCPKCKGTQFEFILTKYDPDTQDSLDVLMDKNEVCISCGWESKPSTMEEIKRRMLIMLELSAYKDKELQLKRKAELVDWEGFIIVDIEVLEEK